jgi:hypothetical protein
MYVPSYAATKHPTPLLQLYDQPFIDTQPPTPNPYLIVDLQLHHKSPIGAQRLTSVSMASAQIPTMHEGQSFDSFPDFKIAMANWATAGKFATRMKKRQYQLLPHYSHRLRESNPNAMCTTVSILRRNASNGSSYAPTPALWLFHASEAWLQLTGHS